MCCPNTCNQRMCVEPVPVSPACRVVVAQLSPNASYVPECLSSGDYRPLQCSGDTGERLCWCANVRTGVPYTSTYNDRFPDCKRKCSQFIHSSIYAATFSPKNLPWTPLSCVGCTYGGSTYSPGESYTAEDGCNTWYASRSIIPMCVYMYMHTLRILYFFQSVYIYWRVCVYSHCLCTRLELNVHSMNECVVNTCSICCCELIATSLYICTDGCQIGDIATIPHGETEELDCVTW